MRNKAIFLDRDGTIIVDAGFARDPARVTLLQGVAEALQILRQRGFFLVVVSNQSGIGRGLITPHEARGVHEKMVDLLRAHGIELDAAYYCPHTPEDACSCRKPRPGLLLQAIRDRQIDPVRSYCIGDRLRDMQAGAAVGCHTILLRLDPASDEMEPQSDGAINFVADSWGDALRYILEREKDIAGDGTRSTDMD
jgi:histidinol-phosphate phosphatase family protein